MVAVVVVVVIFVVVVIIIHVDAGAVFVFAAAVKQLHQNLVLFAADANYRQTQIPVAF